MQTAHPRRWAALAVIALAQFMVIMDTSIIGVALPEIQADLGFSPGDLSWVFNAYVVAFGGLLLLGGRLSDLFGAKRLFLTGWVVLAAGSLVAGLAETTGVEIAARAVQGVGAAFIAPSALTLLMMLFGHDPKELMKAFAVYVVAAALLKAMSRRPNRSTAASSAARTSSLRETSQVTASACPPACSIRRPVSSTPSAAMSATTTLAPSRANASAVARPMPLVAPVTKATFLSKRPLTGSP
jgi:nitrate/nitrite transporter NarK